MKTLILAVGLAAATGAMAQAGQTPGEQFIARNDRNGDGRIDAEEHRNFMARLFARRDTNGDGVLGPGEHAEAKGDVSQEAFMAQAAATFAGHDRNGDGFLDADELAAIHADRAAARAKQEEGT